MYLKYVIWDTIYCITTVLYTGLEARNILYLRQCSVIDVMETMIAF